MDHSSRLQRPERGQIGHRRRHGRLSISDETHHVTEAIGDMYGGDGEGPRRDSGASNNNLSPIEPSEDADRKYPFLDFGSPLALNESTAYHSPSADKFNAAANGSSVDNRKRHSSMSSTGQGGISPPMLTRANSSDTASQHFPLNDIDYESSPAAVAQELSNLQAIRRMSMNVDAADPDLPSFEPRFSIPTAAPSPNDDEDDASRMFWVPARIHPELAPKEFKTFVEERVKRIQRRSKEQSELFPDNYENAGANSGGLGRRKSMLSKAITNPTGYHDGAEILERKRSLHGRGGLDTSEPTLFELESLAEDPSNIVRRMSMESSRRSFESMGGDAGEDMPILPLAPGQSLKRSTRTNYRRGSLRKGERVPNSRRAANRMQEEDQYDPPQLSPTAAIFAATFTPPPEEPPFQLKRTQTEPTPLAPPVTNNFSRPRSEGRNQPAIQTQPSVSSEDLHTENALQNLNQNPPSRPTSSSSPHPKTFVSRIASNGRTSAQFARQDSPPPVPQIIETPPPPSQERDVRSSAPPSMHHPERRSSFQTPVQPGPSLQRPFERKSIRADFGNTRRSDQTLDDMANHPSMMPGTSTRTDNLSFIPTMAADEKKADGKKSKERKDYGDSAGSRKSGWSWLVGSEEKSKKDKEEKESGKKSKAKAKVANEKFSDSTRLDVLQTATEGSRGRESIVLDRESMRLEEERRRESIRKSGGSDTAKKDGIFSLFSKKKGSDNANRKSDINRRLSPEPPPRKLLADVDYNWTRFSILEERAIYRMAHMKLANPRRPLCSQVQLSNFMYSYLAKVQQMHPQAQISQKSQQQQQQEQQHHQSQQAQQMQDQGHPHANSQQSLENTFIEDYDPQRQEQEDRERMQQQQAYMRHSAQQNRYSAQQEPQSYAARDLYAEQGLFDGPRQDDGDLW